jgi:hypothetical protein
MLPRLFQLSHPVVLGDRDAGQPMLVRIGVWGIDTWPWQSTSTPAAKYLIRDFFDESPGFFFRRLVGSARISEAYGQSRVSPFCFVRTLAIANVHTNPNAATIGCKRGTGFQSTGAGRQGRLLLCRGYSTHVRRCKTIYLLSGVTSRRAGSGCAAVPICRASCLPQARGLER